MAEIVLFPSVLGLRPAVFAAADRLRAGGHQVHTPDIYNGRVFADMDDAFRSFQDVGIVEMLDRTQAAVAGLPADLVYAGFSNGAANAEFLAASRPGARGAVLIHGALSLRSFDLDFWPSGVPVQVHYAADDPWRDPKEIDAFTASVTASGSPFEFYDYPCEGHLFTDADYDADYDAASTEALWPRVLAFLDRLDSSP